MNKYRGALLLIICAFFVLSCASTGMQKGEDSEGIQVNIAPKKVHEDCTKATAGQKIVYYFNTSMPVNFNIHYHEAGEVAYGVVEQGASRVELSTFDVKLEQYYCLMWTNTNAAEVQLEYSYKVTN